MYKKLNDLVHCFYVKYSDFYCIRYFPILFLQYCHVLVAEYDNFCKNNDVQAPTNEKPAPVDLLAIPPQ